MSSEVSSRSPKKVAWGITGSGDRLAETVDLMKQIKRNYLGEVEIQVFLSKAADQVTKMYGLSRHLSDSFNVQVEANANVPFLAGQLQTRKFEFLLIAPATSNTVAKIALGIGDSLLSNSAIMALKGYVPVYVMPCDYKVGVATTKLPNDEEFKLRVRKEDVENTDRLRKIRGITVLELPSEIRGIFEQHFGFWKLT